MNENKTHCHICETEVTDKDFIRVNGEKMFRCPKCKTIIQNKKE